MSAHLITPQDQPKFPCDMLSSSNQWISFLGWHAKFPPNEHGYTHWRPTQPEAPEPITSEPASKAATTAVHCDRCDPSFTCWSSHESPCRKVDTPPTPAGAEELAAAGEITDKFNPISVDSQMDDRDVPWLSSIIARHFQPLREEHAAGEETKQSIEFGPRSMKQVASHDDDLVSRLSLPMSEYRAEHLLTSILHAVDNKERVTLRTENAALRTDLEQMTSDRNGVMAINEQHRKALTAAEARCKELEAEQVTAMLNKIKVCDQLMLALTDLKKQLDAARQRKD